MPKIVTQRTGSYDERLPVVPRCRVISHVGNPPPREGGVRQMFARIVQMSRLLGVPLWSCSQTVHDQLVELGHTLPGQQTRVLLERLEVLAELLARLDQCLGLVRLGDLRLEPGAQLSELGCE